MRDDRLHSNCFSHLRSVIITYLSFLPLITRKLLVSQFKSFSHLHSMLRDGMLKNGRKIILSPMNVTLKASAIGIGIRLSRKVILFKYKHVLRQHIIT